MPPNLCTTSDYRVDEGPTLIGLNLGEEIVLGIVGHLGEVQFIFEARSIKPINR